jgi:hypothetical protein
MYEIVRALIDDVLMGPTLAPFTTFGLVFFLGLSIVAILSPADPDVEGESD